MDTTGIDILSSVDAKHNVCGGCSARNTFDVDSKAEQDMVAGRAVCCAIVITIIFYRLPAMQGSYQVCPNLVV